MSHIAGSSHLASGGRVPGVNRSSSYPRESSSTHSQTNVPERHCRVSPWACRPPSLSGCRGPPRVACRDQVHAIRTMRTPPPHSTEVRRAGAKMIRSKLDASHRCLHWPGSGIISATLNRRAAGKLPHEVGGSSDQDPSTGSRCSSRRTRSPRGKSASSSAHDQPLPAPTGQRRPSHQHHSVTRSHCARADRPEIASSG